MFCNKAVRIRGRLSCSHCIAEQKFLFHPSSAPYASWFNEYCVRFKNCLFKTGFIFSSPKDSSKASSAVRENAAIAFSLIGSRRPKSLFSSSRLEKTIAPANTIRTLISARFSVFAKKQNEAESFSSVWRGPQRRKIETSQSSLGTRMFTMTLLPRS